MRRQADRTQKRDGNQNSAKEKNRSGPQFQVCHQCQHDHGNRHTVAEDVVLGALVASRKAHCRRRHACTLLNRGRDEVSAVVRAKLRAMTKAELLAFGEEMRGMVYPRSYDGNFLLAFFCLSPSIARQK
jgi:hypothetical protein